MAYFLINRWSNNDGKWVTLFNDNTYEIRHYNEKELIDILKSGDLPIRNAGLKDGKIVGITGNLDKIVDKNNFVVLGRLGDKYKLVDNQGNVKFCVIPEIPKLLEVGILQNAKLVTKNDKQFLVGIKWEIPEIEEIPEVSGDEEYQKLFREFGGAVREIPTYGGRLCFLATKVNEYALYIPSNVYALNDGHNGIFTQMLNRLVKVDLMVIGGRGLQDCRNMFTYFQTGKIVDFRYFDTSRVKFMECMFEYSNIKFKNLDKLNTSKVRSMRSMFYGCQSSSKLDLTNFDTRNVKDMWGMFAESNFSEVDVSNFDVKSVKSKHNMFEDAKMKVIVSKENKAFFDKEAEFEDGVEIIVKKGNK